MMEFKKLGGCTKCGGAIVEDEDGDKCFNCGKRFYTDTNIFVKPIKGREVVLPGER